jgi:hypothetical protein
VNDGPLIPLSLGVCWMPRLFGQGCFYLLTFYFRCFPSHVLLPPKDYPPGPYGSGPKITIGRSLTPRGDPPSFSSILPYQDRSNVRPVRLTQAFHFLCVIASGCLSGVLGSKTAITFSTVLSALPKVPDGFAGIGGRRCLDGHIWTGSELHRRLYRERQKHGRQTVELQVRPARLGVAKCFCGLFRIMSA